MSRRARNGRACSRLEGEQQLSGIGSGQGARDLATQGTGEWLLCDRWGSRVAGPGSTTSSRVE